MPRVTPESKTKWYLLRGKRAEIARWLGVDRRTIYNRLEKPGELRLSELAILAKKNELSDEQIAHIVKLWQ